MRTIHIDALKAKGVDTWTVKDNSPRGVTAKYTEEVEVGDMVVLNNYFVRVVGTIDDSVRAATDAEITNFIANLTRGEAI